MNGALRPIPKGLLKARPCAGESDPEIAAGAWDFERVNRRHARHLNMLAERETWLDAVTNDPLLPGRILPSDDLGQPALVAVRKDRRRAEVLRNASRQRRTFHRA